MIPRSRSCSAGTSNEGLGCFHQMFRIKTANKHKEAVANFFIYLVTNILDAKSCYFDLTIQLHYPSISLEL